MAPLFVLIIVTLIARALGTLLHRGPDSWPAAARIGLAVMFCFTAAAHFNSMRGDLINMVPAWVPWPDAAVTFTGVCEILGAIGLLIPRTRKAAGVALILFLVAVFPANARAAQAGLLLRGEPATPFVPRLLIQLFFIAVTWRAGVRASGRRKN